MLLEYQISGVADRFPIEQVEEVLGSCSGFALPYEGVYFVRYPIHIPGRDHDVQLRVEVPYLG